jgi:Tol biopolymer transport system component
MKIAPITSTDNAGAAALSPDRRYVVYVLQDGAQQSLWVQHLATGSNVQILPPDQVSLVGVSFTPDGNYVMFVRSDKSTRDFRYLFQMPVLGGAAKQLIRDIDSAPAFSPDGKQFAFIRGVVDTRTNEIVVAEADGSGERVLARRSTFQPGRTTVSWSADGRNLAMVSPEARENGGKWILETFSAKSGEEHDLHAFSVPARASTWLPDGGGIPVVGADPEKRYGQIWNVSYPGGETSRFTNDLTNYDMCCLGITRDVNSLVVLQDKTASDVWVGRSDGPDAKQLTSGETLGLGLHWIGNRIAAGNDRVQWFLMDADGGNRAQLTTDQNPEILLGVCPDGKHILYNLVHNGGVELWQSGSDGSSPTRFAPGVVAGGAVCSPDSKSAFYPAEGAIWRAPLDGGPPEKTDFQFGNLGFSLDGKLEFYVSRVAAAGAIGQFKLVITAIQGGAVLHTFDITSEMASPEFTPGGKAIAFLLTRNHATNIWEQPLAGGEIIPLTKFTSGEVFAFSWSQDGKQLAFSRGQNRSDVIMMSNFH